MTTSRAYFEGGGSAAANGLGGMDGARRLLNADTDGNNRGSYGSRIFSPVSLSIIPKRESNSWTLVATSSSGVRMYFTTLNHTNSYGGTSHTQHRPVRLALCHVRAPPSLDKLERTDVPNRNSLTLHNIRPQRTWTSGDITVFASTQMSDNRGGNDVLVGAITDYSAHPDAISAADLTNRQQPLSVKLHGKKGSHSTEYIHKMNGASSVLSGGLVWSIAGEFDPSLESMFYYSRALNDSSTKPLPPPYIFPKDDASSRSSTISSILRGEIPTPPRPTKRQKMYSSTMKSSLLSSSAKINPLPHLSTYAAPKRILVLTTGSLHVFYVKDTFDVLHQNILSSTSVMEEWVKAYGNLETVCMLISLATNDVDQYGSRFDRCVDAIMKYGCIPSVATTHSNVANSAIQGVNNVPTVSGGTALSVNLNTDNQCHTYIPTILHNALYLNAMRFLRPIWHAPAVICKGNLSVNIISEEICNTTLRKISGLMHFLKKSMTEVVDTNPFAVDYSSRDSNSDGNVNTMNADGDVSEWLIHRGPVQRRTNFQQNSMMGKTENRIGDSSYQKQMEREKVHSLFRLLKRTQHLLTFLRILRQSNIPDSSISWGLLHNISVADLVCHPNSQERIDLLLDAFLVSEQSTLSVLEMLQKHCYLYYSRGVRYLAMGYACNGKNMAGRWFRQAARYWKRYDILNC